MARIAMWCAAALLVMGMGSTPAQAQAFPSPNLEAACGDLERILTFSSKLAIELEGETSSSERLCRAACGRVLAGCRAAVRRLLACENASIRSIASSVQVLCRLEDGGAPKAVRECRTGIREQVASERNDREDIRNALSACGNAVGDCNERCD
jgi:hypothetical protein